ncbi:MAG TPA: response regulator [Polyangia bacterium]|nr:response regulator [Polyangia bacterium]
MRTGAARRASTPLARLSRVAGKLEPAAELSAFLERERARVTRRLRAELRALGRPPDGAELLVDELARVVAERGEQAPRVFAGIAAELGQRQFAAGASMRDLGRELGALAGAILHAWRQARGRTLSTELAALLNALTTESVSETAAVVARAERQETSRALDAALRLALDQVEEAVRVFDRDGALLHATATAGRVLGESPQPSDAVREALRTGSRAGPVRAHRSLADEEHQLEVIALPILDGARLEGAIEVTRDLTPELRHVEELTRADRELGALHARVRRLGHDRAMGDLASGAALALNNELNAITLRLRLVRADAGPLEGKATLARHLEALEAAAQKSASLVARLQELAARRPHGPPAAVELNAAVLEALDLVRPELTAAATDRSVRVDARLGHAGSVLAASTELRELLCALLVAARDALPAGGVLQLGTRRDREHGEVRFVYAAPAGDDSATLALEAARDSARRLGGALDTDVSNGVITHRLLLPRAAPAPELAPAPAARPADRGARRVLIVDDDAGNRETLVELLALSGYQADAAADSLEALAAVEARDYHAALVDLAMPEMNGWELARRLRALHPELRIAIVTGWEPAAGAPAPAGAAERIFRKPIDLRAVQAFLDEGAAAHAS